MSRPSLALARPASIGVRGDVFACSFLWQRRSFGKRPAKRYSNASSKANTTRVRTAFVLASSDVPPVTYPRDYDELIKQVQDATSAALKDGKTLLEIEFPTASLDSVSGDAEGGIEMTNSMRFIRQYCQMFSRGQNKAATRIFFPDLKEVAEAQQDIFSDCPFSLDYLTAPSGLEDIGLGKKLNMGERVRREDELFLAAYPHFNVNEMLAVQDLYNQAARDSNRPIVIFNGELDRIRTGYYPSFFYPKLGAMAKNFLPLVETVYYIHNFKGRLGGKLFRAYPGPWRVLRESPAGLLECVHTQIAMPTLKDVALEILPASVQRQ